jgi:hypothetical protein
MPLDEAKVEIEKGFVATSYVLGQPIAPFFRFPGLNHSEELNAYLAKRNLTVWSVDVVSDDTQPGLTADRLVEQTMERVNRMHGGILLFHDLKDVTAEAMDTILTRLKKEGYKVVHVVSNASYQPNPELVAKLDMTKQSLTSVSFTGVAAAGHNGRSLLTHGNVDIAKSEFVNVEGAAMSSLQEAAAAATRPIGAKPN